MSPASAVHVEILASFRRINLYDQGLESDLDKAWTSRATLDRIAVEKGQVGLGTERPDTVGVDIEVLNGRPGDQAEPYDHITEASLETKSGALVILGPTDYEPDAPRVSLFPGSWRLRSSHAGLRHGTERIRLQLWPAPPAAPEVLKRWQPRRPRKKSAQSKPIDPARTAIERARAGSTDAALDELRTLAANGNLGAKAAMVQLCGFRHLWAELAPFAEEIISRDPANGCGLNVFVETLKLVRRAARELGDASVVEWAAARIPVGWESTRDAVLLRDAQDPADDPPDPVGFAAALEYSRRSGQYDGAPAEREAHEFALATFYRIDDEILARWNSAGRGMHFDSCVPVARALVRRGEVNRAFDLIVSELPRWIPVAWVQVAPVILLLDSTIAPVMTRERCEKILATPRGPLAYPADGATPR
jgi:hypothetical protein